LMHLPNQNPVVASNLFAPGIWESAHKLAKPSYANGRAFITPRAEATLLHSVISEPEKDLMGKRMAVWSHLNLLERVPKVNGSSTLQIKEQSIVQKLIYDDKAPDKTWLLDFLNVTATSSPESPVSFVIREGSLPFIYGGQKPQFLPTNLIVNALTNSFDPASVVYVDAKYQSQVNGITNSSEVKIGSVKATPHEISFEADAKEIAIVTVGQSYYSCWKAEVNGKEAPILPVNLAFQGLQVGPGKNTVLLRYIDNQFRLGLGITVGTLAGLAVFYFLGKR
jgi:hypothetical protein